MPVKNDGFTFKQFHLNHDRCAMKVGTDGILLGSWGDISQVDSILELGTGCGLVALMLAQRTNPSVRISAVEIDSAAFEQAKENILSSPWPNKIKLYHQDIDVFGQNCHQSFDLIVANPPYFSSGVKCGSLIRNMARHTGDKTHLDWLNIAANCLTVNGNIRFILPFEAGKVLMASTSLYCVEYCPIITKIGKPPQRVLLTFSPLKQHRRESQLIIYDEYNRYHQDFIRLTKDFYLKH